VAGVLYRGCVKLLSGDLRPGFDVFVHVEQLIYRMGVDHIKAILVLEQSSSTLLYSRRLFVARILRCRLHISIICIILLSWSQCIWAVLEQMTWKAPIYPRHFGARRAPHQLPHADFVAP
jgi:hypothetical protein